MNELLSPLYAYSGVFCLGAGAATLILFALASHNTGSDDGEGCMGRFIMFIAVVVAIIFFSLAYDAAASGR